MDGFFAAGAGGDEDGFGAGGFFQEADVAAGGGREVFVPRDGRRLGFPAGEGFVNGLEAFDVFDDRGERVDRLAVQAIANRPARPR